MSAFAGPQPIPSGLTFAVDAASSKSFSQNAHPYPLDVGTWAVPAGAYQATLSRDTTVTDSPAGGVPLKMAVSAATPNSAYVGTYNSTTWNIAPALNGQTWTVSFWVKGSSAFSASMLIFEANSAGNYTTYGTGSYSVTTGWTRVSATYTMTQSTTAYIQMRFDNYNVSTNMWVDGLQVERNSAMTAFNPVINASGTTWNDIGGKNSATLAAYPTYSTANNGSFLFNGTSQSASTAAAMGGMGTGDWTISCWWKSNGAQGNYSTIIGQGFTGSVSNGSWAFKVSSTSGDFNFTYCTPSIVDNTSSNNPNDDIWHNLVAIRSGTSLILYKDTVSVKSITLPGGQTFGTGATTYIGYNPRDSAYIKGYLANLTVHNVAWTTDQLTSNFNAQRARFGI